MMAGSHPSTHPEPILFNSGQVCSKIKAITSNEQQRRNEMCNPTQNQVSVELNERLM